MMFLLNSPISPSICICSPLSVIERIRVVFRINNWYKFQKSLNFDSSFVRSEKLTYGVFQQYIYFNFYLSLIEK